MEGDSKPEGETKPKLSASAIAFNPNPTAAPFIPGGFGGDAPPADVVPSEADVEAEAAEAAKELEKEVEDAERLREEAARIEEAAKEAEEARLKAIADSKAKKDEEKAKKAEEKKDAASPPGAASGGGGGGARWTKEMGDPYAYHKATVEVPAAGPEEDKREHANIVFIGHVDAGKSTLSGNILFLTDMVDQRTIDKYTREAKTKNRESWFLAFIMDTDEDEREKGKTVEVGRAHFETKSKRFTILDAPGHKSYVPNMIQGASQADVAVLVISARKGEFETGFDRGGQTREHAMLAKTLGVSRLIVAINKMDDPTVAWSQERYDFICKRMSKFLKDATFKKKYTLFVPISALKGENVKEPFTGGWYEGPTLLQAMDDIKLPSRDEEGALRLPVIDRYGDRGVIVMGKVEVGVVFEGMPVVIQPTGVTAYVENIVLDDETEVKRARPGESVRVRLRGVEEAEIQKGFVVCDPGAPCPKTTKFKAQLVLQDLGELRVFTAGRSAILHLHTVAESVTVEKLIAELDPKTQAVKTARPRFIKSKGHCTAILTVPQSVALEKFDVVPQLGRFSLRDEGRTIAIGVVTGIPPPS